MRIRIAQPQIEMIRQCASGAMLGIILTDGSVVLKLGDAIAYPGHREWIRRDGIINVSRGFSLSASGGRVLALACASVVNPSPDCLPEAEYATQLEASLPLADDYQRILD